MNLRGLKYVERRGDIFQLRIPVPKDLQERIGRKEIRWTLNTSERSPAARRAMRAALVFHELCDNLRSMPDLSENTTKQIIQRFYEKLCESYQPIIGKTAEQKEAIEAGQMAAAEDAMADIMSQLDSGTYGGFIQSEAMRQITQAGIDHTTLSPISIRRIEEGVARAYVEQNKFVEFRRRTLLDEYIPADSLFRIADEKTLVMRENLQSTAILSVQEQVTHQDAQPSITTLVEKFLEEGKNYGHGGNKGWVDGTSDEYSKILNWFIASIGADKTAKQITTDHVRNFKNNMLALRKGASRDLPLEKALASGPSSRISPKTAKKYFDYSKTFLKWLEQDGYLDKPPGLTLKVKAPKTNKKLLPRAFTDEELNCLFQMPLYMGNSISRNEKYWLPLILLYTGMRISEAVMMMASNVKLQAPSPHFVVTAYEGSLKTSSSERKIPIHGDLLKLGFEGFVQKRQNHGGRLLASVNQQKDPSDSASKALNRLIRKEVTEDKRVVVHSFRHLFQERAESAQLPHNMIDALLGHSNKDTNPNSYGGGPDIESKTKALNKIVFPLSDEVFENLMSHQKFK